MSGGRSAMTMRAHVQRSASTSTDPYGQPVPPEFEAVDVVPCHAWSRTSKRVTDDGKEAIVEDLRAIVPTTADVRDGDRLEAIRDRRGRTLFAGPLAVQTRTRRGSHGSSTAHREIMLTRHLQESS